MSCLVCICQLVPEHPLWHYSIFDAARTVPSVQPNPFVLFCDDYVWPPAWSIAVQRVLPDDVIVRLAVTVRTSETPLIVGRGLLTNATTLGITASTDRRPWLLAGVSDAPFAPVLTCYRCHHLVIIHSWGVVDQPNEMRPRKISYEKRQCVISQLTPKSLNPPA